VFLFELWRPDRFAKPVRSYTNHLGALYVAMGLIAGLPLLLLSILAASIVFTWLYNSTRGSLLLVILFHALFDFLSVSRAGGGNVAAIMSAGVMIWAVLVVILFKPATLSHQKKQTA